MEFGEAKNDQLYPNTRNTSFLCRGIPLLHQNEKFIISLT